jgi:hypothetical protein
MTFSVAVAFMAGWLALALMLRQSDPPGPVADREVPAMPTKQPPRVAAAAAITRPLVAASQLLSPKADPVAATGLDLLKLPRRLRLPHLLLRLLPLHLLPLLPRR